MRFYYYLATSILLSFISAGLIELYGTGERYFHLDATGFSLGESYYFSDRIDKVSNSSISTYWKSNLTRFTFSTELYTNISGIRDKDINVYPFSFIFPINKFNTIGLGLIPFTRSTQAAMETSGYYIGYGSSDFFTSAMHSYSTYEFTGGISDFYLVLSTKINKNNSFGVKLNKLFGNQLQTKKTIISSLDYSSSNSIEFSEEDSTYQIVSNQFNGYSVQLDWMLEMDKHLVGFSITSIGPIEITHRSYYNLLSEDSEFLDIESANDLINYDSFIHYSTIIEDDVDKWSYIPKIFNRINDYSIGYHYYNSNSSGIILEFHRNDLFNNISTISEGINIFNNIKPWSNSYKLGLYKRYSNTSIGFWDTVYLRIGGHLKQLFFQESDGENYRGIDIAITTGIGIKIKNSNLIGLGIKFGRFRNDFFNNNEYYMNAMLSFEIGNRWFEKARSKK